MLPLHITNLLKTSCFCIRPTFIKRSGLATLNLKPPWNVMFFGTDEFSLSSLKLLHNELKKGIYINNLEVVTSMKAINNAVMKYSLDQKLHIHDWPLIIKNRSYDIGIVVSFGHLIPKHIIDYFHYGILNVHASLLPRWRGAAPIIYAIANEDTETGITIMRICPEKFDIGDIVKQKCVDIPENILMPELHKTLAETGAKILLDTLYLFPKCLEDSKPQPDVGITYAPRVTSQMSIINFETMTARKIYSLYRALYGSYPLQTKWENNVIKLYDVELVNIINNNLILSDKYVYPGFITYDKIGNRIFVYCSDEQFISVKRIGIVGKKPMTAKDFNNGYIRKANVKDVCFR